MVVNVDDRYVYQFGFGDRLCGCCQKYLGRPLLVLHGVVQWLVQPLGVVFSVVGFLVASVKPRTCTYALHPHRQIEERSFSSWIRAAGTKVCTLLCGLFDLSTPVTPAGNVQRVTPRHSIHRKSRVARSTNSFVSLGMQSRATPVYKFLPFFRGGEASVEKVIGISKS